MKQLFLTFLCFVLGCAVFGQTEFNRAKADSLLTTLDAHHKVMGVVTVRHRGETVYTRSIGYRERAEGGTVPHSEQSRFRIGSVSKMFTSVLVFQLVEEGKLSLDTKLAEFFPQLPNATLIRIDHLLTHGSGLHNFTDDPSFTKLETKPQTQEQMLKRFAKPKPDFAPGIRHEYSNTNFVLLGYIVEKITGKPYAEVLQTRIAEPLGLKDTYYGGKTDLQKKECRSFTRVGDGWEQCTETDMSIPHGAGAIVSTPGDLGLFLEALFAEKLIKRETLDKMTEEQQGYAHGLLKFRFGKKTAYGHGGSIDGFRTQAAYFPKEELALVLCFNGMNYSLNTIAIGMLSIYFNQPYALPAMNTITLTAGQLARYEGTYAGAGFPLKITLKTADGILTAQATGQKAIPLDAVSETEFGNSTYGVVIQVTPGTGNKVQEFVLRQAGQEVTFNREK